MSFKASVEQLRLLEFKRINRNNFIFLWFFLTKNRTFQRLFTNKCQLLRHNVNKTCRLQKRSEKCAKTYDLLLRWISEPFYDIFKNQASKKNASKVSYVLKLKVICWLTDGKSKSTSKTCRISFPDYLITFCLKWKNIIERKLRLNCMNW